MVQGLYARLPRTYIRGTYPLPVLCADLSASSLKRQIFSTGFVPFIKRTDSRPFLTFLVPFNRSKSCNSLQIYASLPATGDVLGRTCYSVPTLPSVFYRFVWLRLVYRPQNLFIGYWWLSTNKKAQHFVAVVKILENPHAVRDDPQIVYFCSAAIICLDAIGREHADCVLLVGECALLQLFR